MSSYENLTPEFVDAFKTEVKDVYHASDLQIRLMLDYMNKKMDEWQILEAKGHRTVWEQVMQYIWVNFAGGNTAMFVTDRIKEKVESS